MSDELTPYRHESTSTHERIAALEKDLALLRAAVRTPTDRALAMLRVSHLREDRDLVAARYRTVRSRVFGSTAIGMIAAFAVFVASVGFVPVSAMYWVICALAVTAVAGGGTALQSLLRSNAEARVRTLDRRIAEEVVVAGVDHDDREAPARVRVSTDVLGVEAAEIDPFDSHTARVAASK